MKLENQDNPERQEERDSFEASLRALSPTASGIDRDRLMYRLGQLSVPAPDAGRWAWPSVAAGLLVASTVLGAIAIRSPRERIVEKLLYVDRSTESPRTEAFTTGRGNESPPANESLQGASLRDPWRLALASGRPLRARPVVEDRDFASQPVIFAADFAQHSPRPPVTARASSGDSMPVLRVGDRDAWRSLLYPKSDSSTERDL